MDVKVVARFWSKVDVQVSCRRCWVWRASRLKNGYGQFSIGTKRRTLYAHRVAWEICNGPIPPGAHILHSCDNPPCCNPAHLRAGTSSENARDMYERFRYPVRRGEMAARSKLTTEQVLEIRALFATGEYTLQALAEKYGVRNPSIHSIVHRRSWRHV